MAVTTWAETEEANGHSVGRQDLFRQFRFLTEHRRKTLADRQHKLQEAGDDLPELKQNMLQFAWNRLEGAENMLRLELLRRPDLAGPQWLYTRAVKVLRSA